MKGAVSNFTIEKIEIPVKKISDFYLQSVFKGKLL